MIYEGSVKGPHVLQPIVSVAVTMVTQPRPAWAAVRWISGL